MKELVPEWGWRRDKGGACKSWRDGHLNLAQGPETKK